jgi:hypothetical protein
MDAIKNLDIDLLWAVTITQYSLFLVRLLFILYFILQAFRYARLKPSGVERDSFTLATFVLMILSSVMFLIGGVFFVTSRLMKRLYGPENEWSQIYGTIMALMSAVMNMGVAFLTQNVAYLCNIYRWQILLEHLKHGEHTHNKS